MLRCFVPNAGDHIEPGLIMLSNTPRRTLSMRRDMKLEAAPWHISIMDQQMTAVERCLPGGNLTKPIEPGKPATR